jgi:hypothetical protein
MWSSLSSYAPYALLYLPLCFSYIFRKFGLKRSLRSIETTFRTSNLEITDCDIH